MTGKVAGPPKTKPESRSSLILHIRGQPLGPAHFILFSNEYASFWMERKIYFGNSVPIRNQKRRSIQSCITEPGITLIPQQLRMSCWYASARMLIQWRQEQSQMCIDGLIPPELDARCLELRDDNKGINNSKIIAMAKRLGLEMIPPMSTTPEQIFMWLKQYGPLWVNGKNHIVVIGGMRFIPMLGWQLQVYDPAPRNAGSIEWRSLTDWFEFGTSKSSRDTTKWAQLSFLHCPAT